MVILYSYSYHSYLILILIHTCYYINISNQPVLVHSPRSSYCSTSGKGPSRVDQHPQPFFVFGLLSSSILDHTRTCWKLLETASSSFPGSKISPDSPPADRSSEVTVGYTQGLNFTAAVLSCAMGRDEAFWCLTALAESVHWVSGNMLQGAVADCECGWPVSILLFVSSCYILLYRMFNGFSRSNSLTV